MEEKIITQEELEELQVIMKSRLELIASFICKGMNECALMELGTLENYLNYQFNNVINLLPGKKF